MKRLVNNALVDWTGRSEIELNTTFFTAFIMI